MKNKQCTNLSSDGNLPRRRAVLWSAMAVVLSSLGMGGQAQPAARSSVEQATDAQIKAAYLCKFGNYIEWPVLPDATRDRPFVIGVMASDAVFDEVVRAATGRTVNGRPISVRHLVQRDAMDDLAVVFIARSQAGQLGEILATVRHQPVLTVTELDEPAEAGGMVNFVVVDDKVRFDIALPQADHSNLKFSARLLALARKIVGKPLP